MDKELAAAPAEEEHAALLARICDREAQVMSVYQQIAEHFADLHDTPGRMRAKGVIEDVVPLAESRVYFYHRLRRRLAELPAARKLCAATPAMTLAGAKEALRTTAPESLDWKNAEAVAVPIKLLGCHGVVLL